MTSVFCYCPHGTIPIAFFNLPSCVHDIQVAEFGKMYDKLEDVYRTMGGKCCKNLAFGRMKRNYLYKSCQDHLGSKGPMRWERKLDLQEKKTGNIGTADGRVGNAHNAGFIPKERTGICFKT